MNWDEGYDHGFSDFNEGIKPQYDLDEPPPSFSYEDGYIDGYLTAMELDRRKASKPTTPPNPATQ